MPSARIDSSVHGLYLNPVPTAIMIEPFARTLHPNRLSPASYGQQAQPQEVCLEKVRPVCDAPRLFRSATPFRHGSAGRCHDWFRHSYGSRG